RSENLDRTALRRGFPLLDEEHGDGVCLLPRCAAGYPHAERCMDILACNQWTKHLLLQNPPCLGVAEEARDADQKIVAQRRGLRGVMRQESHVVGQALDVLQAHAGAAGTPGGASLVAAEVELRPIAQDRQDVVQTIASDVLCRWEAA